MTRFLFPAAALAATLLTVPLPASAERVGATLLPHEEVPAISSQARGAFTADIHAFQMAYELEYSGLGARSARRTSISASAG